MVAYNLILAARDKITGLPENFGGLAYKDVTNIHPAGLAAVLLLGCAILMLPRRWAVIPMLIIACFISSVQKVVVVGLDFNLLRIMVLFGVWRLLVKKEYCGFVWAAMDSVLVAWVISSSVINTLQQGSSSALINRLGFGFDALGMYFLFRCLIRDWADVDAIVFGAVMIGIPIALLFLLENRSGRNVFAVFGGVPEITMVRHGRLRCQGAFSHSILAGCFWASLMPLVCARWWKAMKERIWAVIGLVTSFIVVFCSASSTPAMGALSAVIGGLMFPLRRRMRLVRWGVLITLCGLHFVMNNPVWHLIARVSAVGGSTSWHRYNLINQAIRRIGEWAFIGTRSTAHWGWALGDVTNQYLLEGFRGGLVTLMLFVAVIAIAFREVGLLWRSQAQDPYRLALSWALGVSLFIHCTNFIGVSYFGQIWVVWYLLLAMIGSLSVQKSSHVTVRSRSTLAASRLQQSSRIRVLQGQQ